MNRNVTNAWFEPPPIQFVANLYGSYQVQREDGVIEFGMVGRRVHQGLDCCFEACLHRKIPSMIGKASLRSSINASSLFGTCYSFSSAPILPLLCVCGRNARLSSSTSLWPQRRLYTCITKYFVAWTRYMPMASFTSILPNMFSIPGVPQLL